MRINKYLASCGIASRRGAEEIIRSGSVRINGRPTVDLATDVGEGDRVTVDGAPVRPAEEKVYLMFNKPKGCLTTVSDDRGRKTVFDYLDGSATRLFPVGRLDYDTEGLLLITNDGDFANLLTHPSVGIEKEYAVKVEGAVSPEELERLRHGIVLDGRRTNSAKAALLGLDEHFSRLTVTINEGQNRQVRRMMESIGKTVVFLKRVRIGELKLGGLGRGESRPLTKKEIAYFIIPDRD